MQKKEELSKQLADLLFLSFFYHLCTLMTFTELLFLLLLVPSLLTSFILKIIFTLIIIQDAKCHFSTEI